MHQPWASLLVHGIKRIEGRSWPAPLTGRLWIHAASKVPDQETIQAMEDFYKEIYAVDGITDITFPEHYPVSRLLGCVEVVGYLKREELIRWDAVPESVRLEGLTDFCWLCENPQRLLVPFEMRGFQGVYNLERRIYDAAVRGLCPVGGPLPVRFQLPDPEDRWSLKPGSVSSHSNGPATSAVDQTARVAAAIAGARAAATQFSKKDHSMSASRGNVSGKGSGAGNLSDTQNGTKKYLSHEDDKRIEKATNAQHDGQDRHTGEARKGSTLQFGAPKRIYEAAVRGLSPAQSSLPVIFQPPDPEDPLSRKLGSVALREEVSTTSALDQRAPAPKAGARAPAPQFSTNDQSMAASRGSGSRKGSGEISRALQ